MYTCAAVPVIVMVAVFCIGLGQMRMDYTFWDEPTDQLNVKIEDGVHAGLWTTAEKAERFRLLLEDTELAREQEGNVLYYTPDTYPYLMDEKEMAAYSAWLSISVSHSELDRLAEYYKLCPDKIPDCIYLSNDAGIAPETVLSGLGLEAEIVPGQLGDTLLIK